MAAMLDFKAEKTLGMKKGLLDQGGITLQRNHAPSVTGTYVHHEANTILQLFIKATRLRPVKRICSL